MNEFWKTQYEQTEDDKFNINPNVVNAKDSTRVLRMFKQLMQDFVKTKKPYEFITFNSGATSHDEIDDGIKETLKRLTKLSKYIDHSLFKDKESIWIAQKEGRANDGNDFSDVAILKMLYLCKRKELSFSEWVKTTNIIPISISYEYDPLDIIKATGWDHHETMTLEEINKSDLEELAKGLFGNLFAPNRVGIIIAVFFINNKLCV